MNDEAIVEKPDVVVDMTGFNQTVEDKFKEMEKKMEELLTPGEEVGSLTESKASVEDMPFDYRIGVAKWLSNEMESPMSLRSERNKYVKIDTNTNARDGEKALRDVFTIKESVSDRGKNVEYVLKSSAQTSLTESIGSVNPDCCIPEVWADDVERTHVYPGSVFWGAWFLRWERGIEGQPGDKVWICTVGTAMATTIAAACAEPTTIGATITCPYITLTDMACAYYMCKNDIESVQPDLITELNAGLGDCLNREIDNYFFRVARTDNCTAGTVLSSAALSGSLIAEAMGSMRNGNQRKWKALNMSTHNNEPIGVLLCVDSENQPKQRAQSVDTQEKQNLLKDKLNVPNVDTILSLIMKDIGNIKKEEMKPTPKNTEPESLGIIKNYQSYMPSSEINEEMNAIFVDIRKRDFTSMKYTEISIPLTPCGLEITQKILSYSVNHATKQHIGHSIDLVGDIPNLRIA